MTLQQLYEQTIKPLPAADRYRLAVLILNDIPPQAVVDASDTWTEEDLQDFSQMTWTQIEQRLEEEERA
jgi:hypothetical protein